MNSKESREGGLWEGLEKKRNLVRVSKINGVGGELLPEPNTIALLKDSSNKVTPSDILVYS